MARGLGAGSVATREPARSGAGPEAGQFRGITPRSRSGTEGTHWAPRAPGTARVDSLRARRAQEAESVGPARRAAGRGGAGRARASQAGSPESEPDPARVRTAAPPRSAPPP